MSNQTFSAKDYMSGAPLPEHNSGPETKQLRHYGVASSIKNKPYTFITYDLNKIYDKIITYESSRDDVEMIKQKLAKMLESVEGTVTNSKKIENKNVHNNVLKPGDYINFCDHDGPHSGILLEYCIDESWILLITSNKSWNPLSRKMSAEEMSIINSNGKGLKSYFAPVWRPTKYITVMASGIYRHRADELIQEFFVAKECRAY